MNRRSKPELNHLPRPHRFPGTQNSARRNPLRTALGATFAAGLALTASGCRQSQQTVFFERADVSLDLPHELATRASGPQGDMYQLVRATAIDVNDFVTDLVEGMATIVEYLDEQPPTHENGDWRIYGPFDDDNDRDLAWAIKIQGDETRTEFVVLAATRGTADLDDFSALLNGELRIDGESREGGINLHFDIFEELPQAKDPNDQAKTFGGTVAVSFDRNIDTGAKNIEIDFQDFQVIDESFLEGDSFYSDDKYQFGRNPDGSGRFHLALWGEFDDNGWSGEATERMQLDAIWDGNRAGRARGRIEEVDGSGDLKHGDLEISECFDADGSLTWRTINEAYASELPDYPFGDPTSCVYADSDL
ncbi:MAG: hypothetical protein V3V08_25645 [Nannocystaceae bacterium]